MFHLYLFENSRRIFLCIDPSNHCMGTFSNEREVEKIFLSSPELTKRNIHVRWVNYLVTFAFQIFYSLSVHTISRKYMSLRRTLWTPLDVQKMNIHTLYSKNIQWMFIKCISMSRTGQCGGPMDVQSFGLLLFGSEFYLWPSDILDSRRDMLLGGSWLAPSL